MHTQGLRPQLVNAPRRAPDASRAGAAALLSALMLASSSTACADAAGFMSFRDGSVRGELSFHLWATNERSFT